MAIWVIERVIRVLSWLLGTPDRVLFWAVVVMAWVVLTGASSCDARIL